MPSGVLLTLSRNAFIMGQSGLFWLASRRSCRVLVMFLYCGVLLMLMCWSSGPFRTTWYSTCCKT